MLRSAILYLLLTSPAFAEEWTLLDDAGITAALSARVLHFQDGSTQNFFTDGRTLFEAGAGESWGKWWVSDGKYCSTWPPSDVAACYTVEALGPDVRFTSKSGDVSVGRYVDL